MKREVIRWLTFTADPFTRLSAVCILASNLHRKDFVRFTCPVRFGIEWPGCISSSWMSCPAVSAMPPSQAEHSGRRTSAFTFTSTGNGRRRIHSVAGCFRRDHSGNAGATQDASDCRPRDGPHLQFGGDPGHLGDRSLSTPTKRWNPAKKSRSTESFQPATRPSRSWLSSNGFVPRGEAAGWKSRGSRRQRQRNVIPESVELSTRRTQVRRLVFAVRPAAPHLHNPSPRKAGIRGSLWHPTATVRHSRVTGDRSGSSQPPRLRSRPDQRWRQEERTPADPPG